MVDARSEALRIPLGPDQSVSGLLTAPSDAIAGYVLAHGAGAGMNHAFMASVADGLAARDIATLRFQFPSMEKGSKRPDRPEVAHAAVRAAVATAAKLLPSLPLFAGGKSFGGRMTSQAQSEAALSGVRGLILLGFPLHPAGKPAIERAAHLADVRVPMLFLQGSRDALAELELITPVVRGLAMRATLFVVDGADHGFQVPARLRTSEQPVLETMLDEVRSWMVKTSRV